MRPYHNAHEFMTIAFACRREPALRSRGILPQHTPRFRNPRLYQLSYPHILIVQLPAGDEGAHNLKHAFLPSRLQDSEYPKLPEQAAQAHPGAFPAFGFGSQINVADLARIWTEGVRGRLLSLLRADALQQQGLILPEPFAGWLSSLHQNPALLTPAGRARFSRQPSGCQASLRTLQASIPGHNIQASF